MVVMFSIAVKKESQSYFNCGRRAAQFHPVVNVVSPLNACHIELLSNCQIMSEQ